MRSYCAVHVDVGYLLASAATFVTGSSLRRGITVDYPALISRLVAQAEADADLPLLRVNWYDSGARPGGMPDYTQESIGMLPRVKLRLGRLSYSGDQKGVDIRIGLDLAIQSRHRVADVVYLVTGDDDLTEAVEEAQAHGVQVVLLAVPDQRGGVHGVSKHLRREVDAVLVIDPETITETVRTVAIPDELVPGSADPGDTTTEPGATADGSDTVGSAAKPADPGAPTDAGHGHEGERESDPEDGAPGTSAAGTAIVGGSGTSAGVAASAPAPVPGSTGSQGVTEQAASQGVTEQAAETATEQTTETSTRSAPGVPTPSLFARRKATGLTLPGGAPDGPEVTDGQVTDALVDDVAKQVVASWCATATPEALVGLRDGRPIVPSELDRALLLDLSGRAQDDDLDDTARHRLRERFWFHVDRVRMQ